MKLSARNIIAGKVPRIAHEITASDAMIAVD
jgi:molybdopterin-binding protein